MSFSRIIPGIVCWLIMGHALLPVSMSQAGEPGRIQKTAAANEDEQEPLVAVASVKLGELQKNEKIAAKAFLSVDRLPAGGTCDIVIVVDVLEGWHINANAAKEVIPTQVTAGFAHKTEIQEWRYPKGHEIDIEGFDKPIPVYDGRVYFLGKVSVPATAAGETENVELSILHQACKKDCSVPTRLKLTGTVPVAGVGEKVRPANQRLFALFQK